MVYGSLNSCWYDARVVHVRHTPRPHRLSYRLPFFWLDVDQLSALGQRLRWLGVERPGLFAFYSSDHLDGRGPVGERARAFLIENGLPPAGCARVFLLTLCRQWGYVFHPVSFFFSFDSAGEFTCLLAEVNNTFGERHCYLVPAYDGERWRDWWRGRVRKVMHVSPFTRREGAEYEFRWQLPGDRLRVHVREVEEGLPVLDATLSGQRQTLTDRALAGLAVRFPWVSLKVTAAIHWEAVKLWMKGVPFFHQPPPSPEQRAQQSLWTKLEAPARMVRRDQAQGGATWKIPFPERSRD